MIMSVLFGGASAFIYASFKGCLPWRIPFDAIWSINVSGSLVMCIQPRIAQDDSKVKAHLTLRFEPCIATPG